MSDFSVHCGIHGEVLEVGGECSVCTLVERNRLRNIVNVAKECRNSESDVSVKWNRLINLLNSE